MFLSRLSLIVMFFALVSLVSAQQFPDERFESLSVADGAFAVNGSGVVTAGVWQGTVIDEAYLDGDVIVITEINTEAKLETLVGGDVYTPGDFDITDYLALAGGTMTGDLNVNGGDLTLGLADAQFGDFTLYGHTTGSNEGGQINLQLAADHDSTINNYSIDVYQDDIRIFPNTASWIHYFRNDGDAELAAALDVASKITASSTGEAVELGNGGYSNTYANIAGQRAYFGYDSSNRAVVQGGATKGIEFNVNNSTFGSGTAGYFDSAGDLYALNNLYVTGDLDVNGGDLTLAGPANAIMRLEATTDNVSIYLDSGKDGVTGESSTVYFTDNGSNKWYLSKSSSNNFSLYDFTRAANVILVAPNGNLQLMPTSGDVSIGSDVVDADSYYANERFRFTGLSLGGMYLDGSSYVRIGENVGADFVSMRDGAWFWYFDNWEYGLTTTSFYSYTDGANDLGLTSKRWNDLHMAGDANIDGILTLGDGSATDVDIIADIAGTDGTITYDNANAEWDFGQEIVAPSLDITGPGTGSFAGHVTMTYLRLTPQASPPSSPAKGWIYADTDGLFYGYDGSTWNAF